MGSYGMNESVDVVTYNGYAMAPPYSGAVNNTNTVYLTNAHNCYERTNRYLCKLKCVFTTSEFIHTNSDCVSST